MKIIYRRQTRKPKPEPAHLIRKTVCRIRGRRDEVSLVICGKNSYHCRWLYRIRCVHVLSCGVIGIGLGAMEIGKRGNG